MRNCHNKYRDPWAEIEEKLQRGNVRGAYGAWIKTKQIILNASAVTNELIGQLRILDLNIVRPDEYFLTVLRSSALDNDRGDIAKTIQEILEKHPPRRHSSRTRPHDTDGSLNSLSS